MRTCGTSARLQRVAFFWDTLYRAVARALIGGGGVYSYIRVMPDGFLLKSVVFKLISKEISRADHEYMNIHPPPPPPINALATVLTLYYEC